MGYSGFTICFVFLSTNIENIYHKTLDNCAYGIGSYYLSLYMVAPVFQDVFCYII